MEKVYHMTSQKNFPLELIDKKASPEVLKATMSDLNIHQVVPIYVEKSWQKVLMNESHTFI